MSINELARRVELAKQAEVKQRQFAKQYLANRAEIGIVEFGFFDRAIRWFEGDHPRDEKGQFKPKGGLFGGFFESAEEIAKRRNNELRAERDSLRQRLTYLYNQNTPEALQERVEIAEKISKLNDEITDETQSALEADAPVGPPTIDHSKTYVGDYEVPGGDGLTCDGLQSEIRHQLEQIQEGSGGLFESESKVAKARAKLDRAKELNKQHCGNQTGSWAR